MENMDTDVWLETVNKSGSRSQAFPSPPVYKKGVCAAKGDGTKASKIRKKKVTNGKEGYRGSFSARLEPCFPRALFSDF